MRRAIPSVARLAISIIALATALPGCKLLESTKTESSSGTATEANTRPKDEGVRKEGADKPAASPSATATATGSAPGAAGALPPLDRSSLPAEKIQASKDADKAGDLVDEAKDYASAEREYRRAVELDPGNVFARYNVARTLVLQNEVPEGIAALSTLKVDGCHLCTERILAASANADFANAKSDPAFIELTKDMHKSLFKVDVAVKSLIRWFMTTPNPKLEEHEYIDPRSLVVIEDKTKGAKKRFLQLNGSDEFRKHVKEHYPKGIYPKGPRTCAKGCCDFTGSPISGVHLTRLCFKTSGTSAVHLYKIVVEGDPAASFPG